MHAHVSYLTEDCPACLLMLTVERDAFFDLSAAKQKIVAVSYNVKQFGTAIKLGGISYSVHIKLLSV